MDKNVKKNEAYRKKQIEDTTKLVKEEKSIIRIYLIL